MFASSEIDLFEQSTNLDGQFSLAELTLERERERERWYALVIGH